jgi:preprotein translocase subunit SecG
MTYQERQTGRRGWSTARWLVIGAGVVIVAIVVVLLVAHGGSGGSGGGGGGGSWG